MELRTAEVEIRLVLPEEQIVIIRKAKLNDLPSIVEIYNQAFQLKIATADLEPIAVNDRANWFKEHSPERYPIFVSEVDQQVVGWISLSPYRPERAALRFTVEVSYYIHGDYQGQGIGSRLMDFVIRESPNYHVKTLLAIILEHNTSSIALVKKFNFKQWGFLPNVADFEGKECGHLYFGLRIDQLDR